MARKKKEVKKGMSRKNIIRENVIKCIDEIEKDVWRSFDTQRIVELPGTRGMLRNRLKDFKPEEKKVYREVLQDMKKEGILFHKTGKSWAKTDEWDK